MTQNDFVTIGLIVLGIFVVYSFVGYQARRWFRQRRVRAMHLATRDARQDDLETANENSPPDSNR